ncbi:DUF4259 domain-containing protein [Streptomyces sp. AJS327]|uniref:DUF4259 domain-containing protein n=1 Tax=Streptomyces sp. AJS327 TaxID=2545265 RepID=UPI0015DE3A1E|nr:DUF4259 domain-containing protein [Streptomyces sp. AJS327]MBA0050220.1 DUF4259 domain-containing protein [Streptomyces sp. AJS327]
MGTWDVGPFDSDCAADLCGDLDKAAESERASVIRAALLAVTKAKGYLDADLAQEAVAAAALIAAQCPSGEPLKPGYGPEQPLPELPLELREVAVEALDRVVSAPSELVDLWGEGEQPGPWRSSVAALRETLAREAMAPQPTGS